MKYDVEMGSDAVICTKFHEDRFSYSKVDKVIRIHTEIMGIA
jgi:hypothetical protein